MNDKLTVASISDFLQDYRDRSQTFLLEESKEKDDILEVAKARGYNLQNSNDLAGFKTIFTFADKANKNRARLPKEKLLKVLPGIIGKPVDIDHIRNYVVGHYIDYRYKAAEDMVVAYGVFYKSNFGDEWKTAQKLFKAGTLGTSYEIWCPKSKRKVLPDGTYELTEMEIAGGGLMFKEKPAFADAKVLELASEYQVMMETIKRRVAESAAELVCASAKEYQASDMITAGKSAVDELIGTPVNPKALPAGDVVASTLSNTGTNPKVVTNEGVKDNVAVPGPMLTAKLTCGNCRKDFEDFGEVAKVGEVKCPHCFAILGAEGVMKYPPQIINFSMSCPACRAANWKILKSEDDNLDLKCMSCAKSYHAELAKVEKNELMDKLSFVYAGGASCPQCSASIPFSTTNKITEKNLTCSKCGLNFAVDISRMEGKKKINKISEVLEDNLTVSSEKGGNTNMSEEKKEVENVAAVVPEVPVQPVVAPVAPVEAPAAVAPVEPVVVVEPVVPVVEAPVVASDENMRTVNCAAIEASEFALEVSKTLKAEDRNNLKDSDFAVVKTVKNKKTGEPRTIRMYPMHDEAHVRNALARINQKPSKKGLKQLGISVDDTKAKIHAKAKEMGINVADIDVKTSDKKIGAGADMPKVVSRPAAGPQSVACIEVANEKVAGLTPDQVNQMQNQLFDSQKKVVTHKALVKKAVKKIRDLKKAMCQAAKGSDTEVKSVVVTAEELAKMLAEGKPVKASASGFDVTIKVEGKTAEELAEMLAKGEPVMSSVNELNLAKDENESLKAKIVALEDRAKVLETAAVKVLERRTMLGAEYCKGLSEKDILDDGKFEVARLQKENADLKSKLETSSSRVSVQSEERSDADFNEKRNEITAKAFKTGKK